MKKYVLFVILEPYADWEAAYLSSASICWDVEGLKLRRYP